MALRGLTVGPDQTLRLDGNRFRNIGLNLGGFITPIYSQPSTTACAYTSSADQDAMLDMCDQVKAKVVRLKVTPYWPAQWTYGVNGGKAAASATAADREAHYQKIDAALAKLQSRGIGAILTLGFRLTSASDLFGVHRRAGFLTPGSATRNFFQALTQEVVTRYLNNDAVYGYEFSNEENHYLDASTAALGNFPGVNTSYGTLPSYDSAQDAFLSTEYAGLIGWWYGIVSAIDNQRIVMTGNGPNSYSQPGGIAGISTPMVNWHREQVRDNPTNCGSIHFYGGVGYGSPGFKGLNAILTGVRWWQKQSGRAFVLGEWGNQPVLITSLSGDGSTLTINCASGLGADVGDKLSIFGTGSGADGQTVTVATINAARSVVTAISPTVVNWTGSVKGLRQTSPERISLICDAVIKSGTDVALFWMADNDPGRLVQNKYESLFDTENSDQIPIIRAANTALGW